MQVRQQRRSVSQLTEYSECGLKYRLRRLDGAPQTPAGWVFQGVAVHKAIETYEKSDRTIPAADVVTQFLAVWDGLLEEATSQYPDMTQWLRGGRKSTETDLLERRAAGAEQVERYVTHAQAEELEVWRLPDGSPAVEVGFETWIGRVRVTGYIDLIMRKRPMKSLLVRDIKTGHEPFLPIQLVVYRQAVQEIFGEEVTWGDFYLCKNGSPTPPMDLNAFPQTIVEDWFAAMDRSEREGIYLPNPSSSTCRFCSVRLTCPFFSSEVALDTL